MIQWLYTQQKLPQHREHVMVRLSYDFNLASFDAKKRVFVLNDGRELSANLDKLQWLRVQPVEAD